MKKPIKRKRRKTVEYFVSFLPDFIICIEVKNCWCNVDLCISDILSWIHPLNKDLLSDSLSFTCVVCFFLPSFGIQGDNFFSGSLRMFVF